jgi:hypothetical protein
MTRAALALAVAAMVTIAGCSSGAGGSPGGEDAGANSVSGVVTGRPWTTIASAYWIGMASSGPPAAFIFLFESPTPCSALTVANWDKIIGDEQLLEIELHDTAAKAFQIPQDAGIAYLRGNYNPSGESGVVTITSVEQAKRIAGSFTARFAGDGLAGRFEASYCANGVEP